MSGCPRRRNAAPPLKLTPNSSIAYHNLVGLVAVCTTVSVCTNWYDFDNDNGINIYNHPNARDNSLTIMELIEVTAGAAEDRARYIMSALIISTLLAIANLCFQVLPHYGYDVSKQARLMVGFLCMFLAMVLLLVAWVIFQRHFGAAGDREYGVGFGFAVAAWCLCVVTIVFGVISSQNDTWVSQPPAHYRSEGPIGPQQVQLGLMQPQPMQVAPMQIQ